MRAIVCSSSERTFSDMDMLKKLPREVQVILAAPFCM